MLDERDVSPSRDSRVPESLTAYAWVIDPEVMTVDHGIPWLPQFEYTTVKGKRSLR